MQDNNSPTLTGPIQINIIFKTLQLIYPEFLKGRNQEDVNLTKQIWLRSLSRYPVKQAMHVLDIVPDRFPSYCPKLGEFKALCRVEPAHRDYPMLTMNKPDRGKKVLSLAEWSDNQLAIEAQKKNLAQQDN